MLRGDNADLRLAPHGFRLGLLPPALKGDFERYRDAVAAKGAGGKEPRLPGSGPWSAARAAATAAIEREYGVYIKRNLAEAEKLRKFEGLKIPAGCSFAEVKGLSNEARQKLDRARPLTLAQAGRIPGVTPADLQLLWVKLAGRQPGQAKRKRRSAEEKK